MTTDDRLTPKGWAIIVLGVIALALAGCGRKGPLDRPPTAAAASTATVQADTETEQATQPGVFNPTYGTEAAPAASAGRKKPFILDPLLGN